MRRSGFAGPEHVDSRGQSVPKAAGVQKERHLLKQVSFYGADDEARTRYLHLGKVALYQMSYIRDCPIIIANPGAVVNSFFRFD